MAIDDLIQQAGAVIFETLGDQAVFTPAAGDPVTLNVHYDEQVLLQPGDLTAQVYAATQTIEYLLSDIGRQPVEGETFSIGSAAYTVVEVLANDGHFCKCAVKE